MPTDLDFTTHIDPLIPKLKEGTKPSLTTDQQKWYIRKILDLCCSDSKFAEKAYVAILLVLSATPEVIVPTPPSPVATTMSPSTIAIGAPDFVLHVFGTGFTPTAEIFIKDVVAPTTYVSAGELTTSIDMALVVTPGVAKIDVRDQGVVSNQLDFTVTV